MDVAIHPRFPRWIAESIAGSGSPDAMNCRIHRRVGQFLERQPRLTVRSGADERDPSAAPDHPLPVMSSRWVWTTYLGSLAEATPARSTAYLAHRPPPASRAAEVTAATR